MQRIDRLDSAVNCDYAGVKTVFTMLVIMALATTLTTAPLLRLLYRRSGRPLVAAVEA
jgi:hypothetical protein